MRLSDRTTGLALAALGLAAAYGGSRLPPVPGQVVGPSVFPLVVGLGLALCGALVALGIGSRFEEPDPAPVGQGAAEGEAPRPSEWRALLPPALLIFYVLAVERLGFLLTAAAIVLAVSLTLGARLRLAVPLAIFAPLGMHLVFAKLLRVALQPGLLPAPW